MNVDIKLIDSYRKKKLERKRKNLIRLGVPQGQAYAWKDRALRKCPVDIFSDGPACRVRGWAAGQ